MKKLLLTLLLCFYTTNVSALTYSQYSDFSDYQEEVIESDELTDVKTERRYKYYKYKKELGPYEKENIVNNDYPYIDYNDSKYSEESEYLKEKPNNDNGRVIIEHNVYSYKKAKDITYIELKNTNSNNNQLTVKNISLKYKGEEIKYQVELTNAENNTINSNGTMRLIVNDKLILSYVVLTLDTQSTSATKLKIKTGNSNLVVASSIYNYNDGVHRTISWKAGNSDVKQDAYEPYYTNEEQTPCLAMVQNGKTTVYTYKDLLYRKYNLIKDYYNEYLTEPIDEYNEQDSDDYKDYYAKRTRTILKEPEIKPVINIPPKENLAKKLLTKNPKPIINSPSMFLKINDEQIVNSLSNDYGTYKIPTPNQDKKVINEKSQTKNYIFYILLIIILILVLSKLYKNKKWCVKLKMGDNMLKIDIESRRGILFVRLSGKLTKKNVSKLNSEVITLLKKAGIKNIVFNVSNLEYIDNYGKNILKNSFKICKNNKGEGFICLNQNQKLKLNNLQNIKIINDELTAVNLINS